MRSRRRLPWYKQIWWDNIWFHYKKPFTICILIICSMIGLTILGIKGYNYIKECEQIEMEWQIFHAQYVKEQEELEKKKQEEYEKWKNSPYNAVKLAKSRYEAEQAEKAELKEREKNYYKVGEHIVIIDLDRAINYQGKLIPDRIGVDTIREIKDNGIIIGDKGSYSRDYIRKPTSKAEFKELLNMELNGKLVVQRGDE